MDPSGQRPPSSPTGRFEATLRTPIAYDPFLPGRVVELVEGGVEDPAANGAPRAAIVKRTEGPGLGAARRELAAYRTGVAAPGRPDALGAPALLAWDVGPAHVELWLERLVDEHRGEWPLARFATASRHVAAWDARGAAGGVPDGFDPEDAWAERHGQPERVPEVLDALDALRRAPGAAVVMEALHDPGFARTRAMVASTPARIRRLATYPRSLLHHDLVRSNLFALADGATAAIDWEHVGRGPLGVDLAPLVVGSVRRGEASADDLETLERVVLDAYVDGLRVAGVDREAAVREAYRLALGLRWHVVLGVIRTSFDPDATRIRGSRPRETRIEALRHVVPLARHLLDAADARIG